MKKLFTLFILILVFTTNAMAWEPVIKERHWFGVKEFEEDFYPSPGVGPVATTLNCVNNELMSITLNRDWSDNPTNASSFNCWMDDTSDSPKPRFRFNNSGRWDIGKNNNQNYKGYGLRVNVTDGDPSGGSIINIQHLNNGDKIVLEMYCQTNEWYYHQPILMEGSVSGVNAYGYNNNQPTWPNSSNYDIGNPNGVSNEYTYTGNNDGFIGIRIPNLTVIRCITIIYNNTNYKTATTKIERIEDAQNNVGYKMTITGSGVLEEKRGAVPYLTMRYGAENDMTVSKYLGTVNGVKQYGTSSIVDESEPLQQGTALTETLPNGSNTLQLQSPYRQCNEDQNKKSLVGKEWTVFTADESSDDAFNTIYPLYGNYYYFFPEVDGKFHVKFYCEGGGEHMCLWYKLDNGTPVSAGDQVSLLKTKMSTDGGNSWTECGIGGGNNTLNTNFYEYTADFKKGGVYYLCSNPTIHTQQSPIPRLISYSFIPEFRLDPLWYIATDEEKASGIISHAAETNQDFTVTNDGQHVNLITDIKYEGNVAYAEPYFEGKVMKFKSIKYKSETENDPSLNDGGAVIVTVECASGKAKYVLTIPYTAEKAVKSTDTNNHYTRVKDPDTESNPNGKEVKKWDFFSNPYYLGKYSDTSSLLYNEVHKADGLTADWVNTYMDLENEEEHIFKSVYDMEGDNADMIKETEGLVFFTESNQLGIFNENDPSNSEFRDRYIGFIGGGEMWIPNLKAGDRVVLKMGRYRKDSQGADKAHLTITGAQDAVGADIIGDYVIGGSGVAAGNDLNNGADITDPSQPWGEYHFISTGGHFKLKVTDATLLKLYSIVIYKHDETILTENELLGDEEHRQILNTAEFTRADNVQLHMHYRGLNEATNYSADPVAMTGNLQASDVNITDMTSDQSLWYVYSVALPSSAANAKFGVFKTRQGVQTIGEDYVTDYADCMIPVGYRETKEYPYTWDFTDLKKYVSAGIDTDGNEQEVTEGLEDDDLKIWNQYGLRVKPRIGTCASRPKNGTVISSLLVVSSTVARTCLKRPVASVSYTIILM